jgi:hypothetical protein
MPDADGAESRCRSGSQDGASGRLLDGHGHDRWIARTRSVVGAHGPWKDSSFVPYRNSLIHPTLPGVRLSDWPRPRPRINAEQLSNRLLFANARRREIVALWSDCGKITQCKAVQEALTPVDFSTTTTPPTACVAAANPSPLHMHARHVPGIQASRHALTFRPDPMPAAPSARGLGCGKVRLLHWYSTTSLTRILFRLSIYESPVMHDHSGVDEGEAHFVESGV